MTYLDEVRARLIARTKKDSNGCWIWQGTVNAAGYGRTWARKLLPVQITTHRLSWIIHFGLIPSGSLVLHRCDVRRCINPDHLTLGNHSDNIQDAYDKGRRPRGTRGGVSKRLTGEQLDEIRMSSKPISELADHFGIDRSYACRIRKGKAMKRGGGPSHT